MVAAEGLLFGREIVQSVQFVVPEKFKRTTVHLVAARLHHNVHRRAAAPELSAHRIFFGTELLNGIGRWQRNHASQSELIVVHSVQQEVIVRDA